MGETFTTEIQARYRDINLAGHVDNVEAVRVLDEADLVDLYRLRRAVECAVVRSLPPLEPGALQPLHDDVAAATRATGATQR